MIGNSGQFLVKAKGKFSDMEYGYPEAKGKFSEMRYGYPEAKEV